MAWELIIIHFAIQIWHYTILTITVLCAGFFIYLPVKIALDPLLKELKKLNAER